MHTGEPPRFSRAFRADGPQHQGHASNCNQLFSPEMCAAVQAPTTNQAEMTRMAARFYWDCLLSRLLLEARACTSALTNRAS